MAGSMSVAVKTGNRESIEGFFIHYVCPTCTLLLHNRCVWADYRMSRAKRFRLFIT